MTLLDTLSGILTALCIVGAILSGPSVIAGILLAAAGCCAVWGRSK